MRDKNQFVHQFKVKYVLKISRYTYLAIITFIFFIVENAMKAPNYKSFFGTTVSIRNNRVVSCAHLEPVFNEGWGGKRPYYSNTGMYLWTVQCSIIFGKTIYCFQETVTIQTLDIPDSRNCLSFPTLT